MGIIRHRYWLPVLLLAASLVSVRAAADPPTWRWEGVGRVVVFGDVHGAYTELVALLQQTGVVDKSLHWSGGATHLVSLGDLIDRGPGSRAVMDLMMRLETEAPRAGGFVHMVLGNHELMNLTGDYRYVSDAEYASFADASSAAPIPITETRPGEAELRQAFSANGRYGAWLLGHPALIVINDTAYVHGGIPATVGALGFAAANTHFHEELVQALNTTTTTTASATAPADLLSDGGPLWYRGTALCHALIERDRLQHSLDELSVRRVVIGHTPTRNRRASSRFGGIVVMLDTGMLEAFFHGHPTALVIENGQDRVIVAGDQTPQQVSADPTPYSGNWQASDATAALLASAAISASAPVPGANGESNVTLATANGPVMARFVHLSKDRLRRELAAYRLDHLLGLGIVPPAAAREIDGKMGLLTATGSGWRSERQRRDDGIFRLNPCEAGNDYLLMLAFDALIGNNARSIDNLGYDRATHELRLRDQGGAFTRSGLRGGANVEWPKLPTGLRERLIALDEQTLVDTLGDQLQPREIKAVLERRDAIVGKWPALE